MALLNVYYNNSFAPKKFLIQLKNLTDQIDDTRKSELRNITPFDLKMLIILVWFSHQKRKYTFNDTQFVPLLTTYKTALILEI